MSSLLAGLLLGNISGLAQTNVSSTNSGQPQNQAPYGPAVPQNQNQNQNPTAPYGLAPYGQPYPYGQVSTPNQSSPQNASTPFGQQSQLQPFGNVPGTQSQILAQFCLNPTMGLLQVRSNPAAELRLFLDPFVQKALFSNPAVIAAVLKNSDIRSRILSDPAFRSELLNNPAVRDEIIHRSIQNRSVLNDTNAQARFLAANPSLLANSSSIAQLLLTDTVLQSELLNNPDIQAAIFNNPTTLQNACNMMANSQGGYAGQPLTTYGYTGQPIMSGQYPAQPLNAPNYVQSNIPSGQAAGVATTMPAQMQPAPAGQTAAGIPGQVSATNEYLSSTTPTVAPTPGFSSQPGQVPQVPAQQQGWPYQQLSPFQTNLQPQVSPYANVPSLYDLYQQVAPMQPQMQRFGINIFQNGTGNASYLPMDVPVGADYVLGPGDSLNLEMWGGYSDHLQLTVDPQGRVDLPEVGPVLVEGRTLGQAQQLLQNSLRRQFKDVRADLALSSVGTIRVYVVGDVMRPGAYDISSLSTALNALFVAGGPTSVGSLRTLMQYRGAQLIRQIDVYDLLLHGVKSDVDRLQPGDTILVPPIGPQVTVQGMVRRPAIYETKMEKSLAEILAEAGGVLPTGTLRHIEVDRVEAHSKRNMLKLDLPADGSDASVNKTLQTFQVQDGDVVSISPILPYDYQTVYLDGHVYEPGRYPYQPGMHVRDLIKTYADILPEPYRDHAEIIRLMKPDYRPQIIAFNLSDAMEGKINPELEPFDTVRVFGVYDFQDPPTVTVNGEVRNPGQHQINGVMHLRDAIFLAGGLTPNALLEDAQVVRRAEQGWVRVLNVNLQQALEGSEADNILLENLDQIYVQTAVALISPPEVNINGEVSKPGPYTLGRGMKVSDLIGLAGGLLRGAVREYADLTRYSYENGKKVESQVVQVELGRILAGDKSADIELQDGDVLAIRQISGWRDIGASVVVAGEVNHPGTFGIRPGERLSSVLMRAGGFRSTAYPYGAVLERVEVQRLAEKTKEDLITRIEDQQFAGIQFGSTSNSASDSADLEKAFLLEQQQVATHLRETPVIGRLVIRIPDQLKRWINSQDDIELRDGDILTIPKKPNFVLVSGEVYGPNAISIRRGRNAEWYLRQAGGTTELAKKSDIYVIRADGEVIGKGGGGWWGGKVKNLVLQPGDSIVVPEKIMIGNSVWQRLVESASVLGNLAVAGRVATSF